MILDTKERTRILAMLRMRQALIPCAGCGGLDMVIGNTILSMVEVDGDAGSPILPHARFVLVICRLCGCTRMHLTKALGMS